MLEKKKKKKKKTQKKKKKKVWDVKCKKNNLHYAMKVMSKVKIISKHSVKNILSERKFLSQLHNK
jgi:hypothetical protein